ncbi:MAG: carbohydrate-binding family 9-like protein [Saprospiraceae bacterium]|jgi:hypothetical protein
MLPIKWWLLPLMLVEVNLIPLTAQVMPPEYICYQAIDEIIIDGELNEQSWENAEWTADFQDIEGDLKPKPPFRTRAKMLWDEHYFYFAAELEEPHIWATIKERDAVMFKNDDFEIFLDPDGDGILYLEYEMNANNAVWDLLMLTPYRARTGLPHYVQSWDIRGLQSAVKIKGTLNDPSDLDTSWIIEIAMPWSDLVEVKRGAKAPEDKEQWRVNFSRVDWWMEIENGNYQKQKDSQSGRIPNSPQENWVWSPTGKVDIHLPELWGYVQFSTEIVGTATETFIKDEWYQDRQKLMKWYFAQYEFLKTHQHFSTSIGNLTNEHQNLKSLGISPKLIPIPEGFIFEIPHPSDTAKKLCVNHEGRFWITAN